MNMLWCIVFCTLPLLSSHPEEPLTSLHTQFLTIARTENVQQVHSWMAKINYALCNEPQGDHVNGAIVFAYIPADIRSKILTDHFFHDGGIAAKTFESKPYCRALYLLAEYQTKKTIFAPIPAHVLFVLNREQLKALECVIIGNFCNEGRAIYELPYHACFTVGAIYTATSLIGYPKNAHHSYNNSEVTNVLKTIPPSFFKEMKLNGIRIACEDDSSVSETEKIQDAFKKSFKCDGVVALKLLIDIGSIPYNLWKQNTITGAVTSLLLDGAMLYTRGKGYGNNYSYITQRLALELIALPLIYAIYSRSCIELFWSHSMLPHLLLTIPLAYYVRKNERFPHTFVLGEREKPKQLCTIL